MNQIAFESTFLVKDDHILNQIELKEGALLLGPCLANLKQEHSRAAVKIEAIDTVHGHGRLVLEATDSCLFENLFQQNEHVIVVCADNCLLRAFIQVSNQL